MTTTITEISSSSNSDSKKLVTPKFHWPWVVLGLSLAAALIARFCYGSLIIDDAYITFRYVQNFAKGLGYVYNSGAHVLGTTTPLYMLLLTPPHLVGLPLEGISFWYSLLSDCATIIVLYLIGQRLGLPRCGLAAGVLVALLPDYITYSVSGMETSLYTTLLVGAFYLYLRGNYKLTGFVLSLLVLTRPDGLLMVLVLFVHFLLKQKRLPWPVALTLLPLPALWALIATLYYGSPISNSVIAKASLDNLPREDSLLYLIIFLAQNVKPFLTFFAILGIFLILRQKQYQLLRIPVSWWLLYCTVFIWQGAFNYFFWYFIPLLPFYFLFSMVGLSNLWGLASNYLKSKGFRLTLKPIVIAGGIVGLAILAWAAVSNWDLQYQRHLVREYLYRDVATRLAPQLGAGETLAANEIGALGYYCNCQILDVVGLVSPEVIKKNELQVLQQRKPKYIVAFRWHLKEETFASPWLAQNYELAEIHYVGSNSTVKTNLGQNAPAYGQEDALYVLKRRS